MQGAGFFGGSSGGGDGGGSSFTGGGGWNNNHSHWNSPQNHNKRHNQTSSGFSPTIPAFLAGVGTTLGVSALLSNYQGYTPIPQQTHMTVLTPASRPPPPFSPFRWAFCCISCLFTFLSLIAILISGIII